MGLFDFFINRKQNKDAGYPEGEAHEYCTYCYASLPLQKGYSSELPYWICRGCGGMLINPAVPDDSNISWICDGCEAMLNIQEGFTDTCGDWTCMECGFVNRIDKSEIFASDAEYRMAMNSPYRGLDDETILAIMSYEEIGSINNREDILLVSDPEDGSLYVKKILGTYDISIYKYLKEHNIFHMPKIRELYEGKNALIVIEEYIEGRTLEDIIEGGAMSEDRAVYLIRQLCLILKALHTQEIPIIHRDVKPSNIIVTDDDELYLIDENVAKWYSEEENEDTRLMGTQYYAAPEQLGYGFEASSAKTDIYAVGILLNEMLTGHRPKEQRASGQIWNIISRCISMEPDERYSDDELIEALKHVER